MRSYNQVQNDFTASSGSTRGDQAPSAQRSQESPPFRYEDFGIGRREKYLEIARRRIR